MLIINKAEVRELLDGAEEEIVGLVDEAYRLHDQGRSSLPHSTFLRFPDAPANRIIGLPAHLGGERPVAGMKWIASFPGNLARGVDRASAVVVLNSLVDGRPQALIEASLISAKRTAASAALAARLLVPDAAAASGVTLVGCGVINAEVLRFLCAQLPALREVTVFDRDPQRAAAFVRDAAGRHPRLVFAVADSAGKALAAQELVSFATTSAQPYTGLEECRAQATVLHVSLRDLTAASLLESHNVVDDPDHVCRELTSPHLAEQACGGREFIDTTIGALAASGQPFRREPGRRVVFSPFGLGVLDLALARWVLDGAQRTGAGTRIDGFDD